MDRIKTKIIIAVTNKLSAAADTDARTDLIEELSENLYQRYEDLTAEGIAEEEAFQQAMENLGDVNELLAYLADTAGQEGAAANDKDHGNGCNAEDRADSADDKNGENGSTRQGWSKEDFNQLGKEIGKEIGELVGKAVVGAKDAAQYARDMAKDISWDFSFSSDEKRAEYVNEAISAQEIQAVEIKLIDGDVTIHIAEDDTQDIILAGEIEKLESRITQEGSLYIKQGNTASSSFLFTRGWGSSDIDITLPRRLWQKLQVETVSGDICCKNFLEVQKLQVNSVSGDIEIRGMVHEAKFTSKSGDIRFRGDLNALEGSCISGDIDVESGILPEKLGIDTKSGDCSIRIPDQEGFTVNYHTISGDLHSNMLLTGRLGQSSGKALYRDGGNRTFFISTVSGDISIENW